MAVPGAGAPVIAVELGGALEAGVIAVELEGAPAGGGAVEPSELAVGVGELAGCRGRVLNSYIPLNNVAVRAMLAVNGRAFLTYGSLLLWDC